MGEFEPGRLLAYIKKMQARYPGLSERQMALQADLPNNAIYKIRDGVRPRPSTLTKLAEEWGRSADERANDFRQMMILAGYTVPPEDRIITAEEYKWIERYRALSEEQRAQAELFFRAYGAGDTIEVLARGLSSDASPPTLAAEQSFLEFLGLVRDLVDMTLEGRTALFAEALRHFREGYTQADSPDNGGE